MVVSGMVFFIKIIENIRNIQEVYPKEYCSKHPFLDARQELFALESEFNIQKYLSGTCYQQRIDNKKHDANCSFLVPALNNVGVA